MSYSESVTKSASSFIFPNWKRYNTFWEAFAFMVAKGDEEHLPPLVPAGGDLGHSTSKLSFVYCWHH